MNNMKSIARINMNRLYPSSYYAMPSISPLFVGMNGQTGMAQANNLAMYNYTIKQMAMSPFSVNSQEYMKRIREEYGYTDNDMYNVMGTIGAVVGSGIGAYMGTGAYQGIVKSSTGFNVFKPSTYSKLELQNPFRNPWDPKTFSSKQQRTSAAFRQPEVAEFNRFYDNNKTLIDRFNNAVKNRTSIKSKLDTYHKLYPLQKQRLEDIETLTAQLNELKAQPETFENLKKQQEITTRINKYKEDIEDFHIDDAKYKEYLKDLDEFNTASKNVDDLTADILKNADGLSPKALNHLDEAVSTVKPISKMSHAFMSYAGTALDVASAGMNIAGATQAFQDNQYLIGSMYTFGALNDLASVVGDIVASIPTPVTAVVGQVLNIVGTVMSMASDAIIGALVGTTVGHSLTPEGAKAQQLYASNLYASAIQRPISTIATALTMFGVPAALNRLGALQGSKVGILRGIGKTADFLTDNAWGNYLRAGLNMMAVSGIQNIVAPVEEKIFKAPEDPEDVNFVTAFALVGDLNDNLFGATARKATLLGLIKGDASAQTDAIARAWGFSNTDTYYSPTFDDVRQALGWEFSPIGNSLFSTIGEILIDPQNLSEIAVEVELNKVVEAGARSTAAILNVERAKVLSGDTVDPDIIRTLFRTTKDGQIIKTAYRVKEEGGYRYITSDEAKLLDPSQYEAIDVVKKGNNYWSYSYLRNKEEGAQPTEIAQKINITDEQYKSYEYQTTRLGKLPKSALEEELGIYIRKYITNGDEGLSDVYINSLSVTKGSSTKVMYGRDTAFVPALKKYIDQALTGTYHTNADVIRNRINTQSPEEREKYIKDTLSLYSYYKQEGKDTTQLLNKLFMDFNVVLSTDKLSKLYYTHSGFRTQMDLIQNAMGSINKIANPMAWGINSGLMHIGNFLLKQSSEIKDEKKMKLLKEVDEALNDITNDLKQKDVDTAINNIKTRTSKDAYYDEIKKELNSAIEKNVNDSNSELNRIKIEHAKNQETVKQLEEQVSYFTEQKKQTRLKNWEGADEKNTVFVEINNDEDAAKVYKKIKELEEKKRLTTEEKRILKQYRTTYLYYKYNEGLPRHIAHVCGRLSAAISTLDTLSQETNTHLLSLLKRVSKFSTMYTDDKTVVTDTGKKITVKYTDEDKAKLFNEEFDSIEKLFVELGFTFSTIAEDGTVIEGADNIRIHKKDANMYDNLTVQHTLPFNDVVKLVINDTLRMMYGTKFMDVIEILGLSDVIDDWFKSTGVDGWNTYIQKGYNPIPAVQLLMKAIAAQYKGTDLEKFYTDMCAPENAKVIANKLTQYTKPEHINSKGEIIISKPISEVTPTFLRAVAFEHVYKNNKTEIDSIFKSIGRVSKYIDKVQKYVDTDDAEIFKAYLYSYVEMFNNTLKNTTMYPFIQAYMQTYHKEDKYRLCLENTVYEGLSLMSQSKLKEMETKLTNIQYARHKAQLSAEYLNHYASKEEYNTIQRLTDPDITQSIQDLDDEIQEDPSIVNPTTGEVLTEDNVETQDPETHKKRTSFKPINATEVFTQRVENTKRIYEGTSKLTEQVKARHKYIDNVQRNVEFKFMGDHKEKSKLQYYIQSLLNPKKYGAKLFKGQMRVHIQPLGFTDDDNKIHSFTSLGIKEYGYSEVINAVIDDVLERLFDANSSIQSVYIKDKRIATKDKKGLNIPFIKSQLAKAYKEGHLYITYDNKYKKGTTKGTVLSKTTHYFTLKVRTEFSKQLYMAINDKKAKGWNEHKYTADNEGVQAYVKDMYDSNNEDAINFIQDLYIQSIKSVEQSLTYDKGITGNTYIRSWEDKLRRYELSVFAGSQKYTAVISTDIPAKLYADDNYFKECLRELSQLREYIANGMTPTYELSRTILRIHNHISEQPLGWKRIDLKQFVKIEVPTNPDEEYQFVKPDGTKISLLTLVLDYKLNQKMIETIVHDISSKTNTPLIDVQRGINARYDRYVELNKNIYGQDVSAISKEDYVKMVKLQMAPNEYTDQQIEHAYDVLTTHWKEYETATQFRLHKSLAQDDVDYTEYLTEDIYKAYHLAMLRYSSGNIEPYIKILGNPGMDIDSINTPELYFLLAILTDADISIKRKKVLLKNIFFYDYKLSKGMGSKENVGNAKKDIKECEIYIKNIEKQIEDVKNGTNTKLKISDLEEAKKRALTVKATLIWRHEYFEKINKNMLHQSDKDELIEAFFTKQISFGDLVRVYYGAKNFSDTSKYLPAFTDDGHIVIVKADYVQVETKGAGPLNTQIIGRFRSNIETGKKFDKKEINNKSYDVWTSGLNHNILVKVPSDTDAETIKNIKSELQLTYTNVYILKESAFQELLDMIDEGKIATYNTYKAYKDDTHEKYAGEVDTQINVKGSKVRVPALMHDLGLIENYLKRGTYKQLEEYLHVEKLIKPYISYGVDNRLLSTSTFRKFESAAKTTLAFFEFIEAFRIGNDIPFNLNALAEYFNDEAIKYNIYSKDTTVWRELEHVNINGKKGTDVLEEIINTLHEKYKDSDAKFDHSKVLHSEELLSVMDNLYAIAVAHTKQNAKLLKEAIRLRKIDHRYTRAEIDNIQDIQLKETYNVHNIIQKEYLKYLDYMKEVDKGGQGTNSSIYKFCKLNKSLFAREYNTIAERHRIQIENYRHSNVNLKTIYHVIPVFNDLKTKIDSGKFITADDFSTVQCLWNSVQHETGDNLLEKVMNQVKSAKKFTTDDEVYTYMFNEILYPLVQNIVLGFNVGNDQQLAYSALVEIPQANDPQFTVLKAEDLEELDEYAINFLQDYMQIDKHDYNGMLKSLDILKANTKAYIKRVTNGKDVYGINIDKYIDEALQDVMDFLLGPIEESIQLCKQNNEEMYIYSDNLIDKDDEIIYAQYVQQIISSVLSTTDEIIDVVDKEYMSILSRKQNRYKIVPDIHFKKYKYMDGVKLSRDKIMIYADKQPRDKQQAPTFTDFLSQDINLDKTIAEQFIGKIAQSLTKSQAFTEDKNKIAMPAKSFVEANTFYELDYKVMEHHEKYINTIIEEVKKNNPNLTEQEVYTKVTNLYIGWLHFVQNHKRNILTATNKKNSMTARKEAKDYINNTRSTLIKQGLELNLSIEFSRTMYNTIMEHWGGNEAYQNTYYEIIHALKAKRFDKSTQLPDNKWDLISLINTNVLLYDTDFYEFFKTAFDKTAKNKLLDKFKDIDPTLYTKLKMVYTNLSLLKLPNDVLQTIKKGRDINWLFKEISTDTLRLANRAEEEQIKLLALCHLINEAKDVYRQLYVTYETTTKKEAYSWDYARYKLEREKRRLNNQLIHSLDAEKVFYGGADDGTNVFTNLSLPVRGMKKVRSTIKALNNNLKQMIITNAHRYVKSIDPVTVVYRENNINTQIRNIQTYYTSPLFKETSLDISAQKDLKQQLERAYADSYIYLMSEATAASIDKLLTVNKTYYTISKLFTDVLKILNPNMKDIDFIKIADITTFLRAKEADTTIGGFYLHQFNLWQTKDIPELKTKIEKVVDHFNSKSYLVDLNEDIVKAFFGYMYYNKFSGQFGKALTIEQKRKEIREYHVESWLKQQQLDQSRASSIKTAIHNIMYSNRTIDEKVELLLNKLYDPSDREKNRSKIQKFLEALNAVDTQHLTSNNILWDTYEAVTHDDPYYNSAMYKFGESVTTVLQQKQEINDIEKEIESLTKRIRGYRSSLTRKDLELKYATEHYEKDGKKHTFSVITEESYAEEINRIQEELITLQTRHDQAKIAYEERRAYLQDQTHMFMLRFINTTNYLDYYKKVVNEKFDKYIEVQNTKLEKNYEYIDTHYPGLREIITNHQKVYEQSHTEEFKIISKYRKGYSNAEEMQQDTDLVDSLKIDLQITDTKIINEKINNFWNIIKQLDEQTPKVLAEKYLEEHPEVKSKLNTIKKRIRNTTTLLNQITASEQIKNQYNNATIFDTKNVQEQEQLQYLLDELSKDPDAHKYIDWLLLESGVNWDAVRKAYVYAVKSLGYKYKNADNTIKQQITDELNKDILDAKLSKEEIERRKKNISTRNTRARQKIDTIFKKWINKYYTKDPEISTSQIIKNALKDKEYNIDTKHEQVINAIDKAIRNVTRIINKLTTSIENNTKKLKQSEDALAIELAIPKDIQNKDTIKKLKQEIKTLNALIDTQTKQLNKYNTYKSDTQTIHAQIKDIEKAYKQDMHTFKTLNSYLQTDTEEYKLVHNQQVTKLMQELAHGEVLTEEDILILNELLSSDYGYDKDTLYKACKDELDSIKTTIKNLESQKDTIDSIRQTGIEARNKIKEAKSLQSILEHKLETYKSAQERYNIYDKNKTNSRLYALYSSIDPDTDLVAHLIERASNDGILTQQQMEQIKAAGKIEKHNPVVDILFTLYNYAYQQGAIDNNGNIDISKLPSTFIVMDMETVRDINNSPTPYQISLIRVQIENGEIKTNIATASYNNTVFNDGTVDDPKPLLAQFIKDQTEIMRKENPNITDEEIKERVKDIVNKHKYLKNNFEETSAVVNILNQANCPIVAHNGTHFDFPVFNKHIRTYTERLVMNELNTILYTIDTNKLCERFGITLNMDIKDYPKELQDEIQKELEQRLHALEFISSEEELNRVKQLVDKMYKYRMDMAVQKVYAEVLQKLGYVKDQQGFKDIINNPDSAYNRAIDYITDYVYATNDERTKIIQNVYNILREQDPGITIEKTKELVNNIYEDIILYKDGTKQVKYTVSKQKQIINEILQQLNVPLDEQGIFDYTSRITTLENQINSIDEIITFITANPNAIAEYEKHKHDQEIKKGELEKQNTELEKQIKEYEAKIEKIETKETEFLQELASAYKNINDIILPSVSRAYSLIYSNSHLVTSKTKAYMMNEYMTSIDLLQYELRDAAWSLDFILKALQGQAEEADLKNILLHPAILGIKNTVSAEETLKILNTEIENLNKIKTELNTEGESGLLQRTKNKIMKRVEDIIESVLNNIRTHAFNMLKDEYDDNLKLVLNEFTQVKTVEDVQNAYKKLYDIVSKDVALRNNRDIQTLRDMTSTKSQLQKSYALLQYKDKEITYSKELLNVYNLWIDKQIETDVQTVAFINAVYTPTIEHKTISSLKQYLDQTLTKIKQLNDQINIVYADALELSMFRQSVPSRFPGDPSNTQAYNEWKKEAIPAARKQEKDNAYIKKVKEEYGITYVKANLDDGSDLQGFTLSSEHVWYRDVTDNNMIIVYTYDEEHHQVQSVTIPYKIEKGKKVYSDPENWRFQFTYNYKQQGHEYQKAQSKTLSYRYKDITNINDIFKDPSTKEKTKTLLPVAYKYLYHPAQDTSMIAIKQLYKWVQMITSKKGITLEEAIKNTTVNLKQVPLHKLANINISERVRKRFVEYLPLITAIQKDNPKIANPQDLYMNIYEQVMAEYKVSSVNPGKYLSLLPEDLEHELMWQLTEEGIKKFNVDKKYVTEANMGRKFNPESLYSCDELFGINTNYVRTLLASSLFRFKYSILGVVNDLYKDNEKADEINFNLAESLTEDKYNLNERIKARKEKLLQENPNMTEEALKHIEQEEQDLYNKRKKLLYKEYTFNNKTYISNMFTPHVGTITQQENFRQNIYIQGGVNVTVAFADDPRAYEDTMLIDADDAKTLGADYTNKLWLKFGFKGGIRIVPGLRKMYGASIVASRASVVKRGSYGMYMEMAVNKIRSYTLGILNKNDVAYKYLDNIKLKLPQYTINETIEKSTDVIKKSVDEITDPIYLVNDKVYVSPDYDESQLNKLLKIDKEDIKQNKDYKYYLINDKATNGTYYNINNPITNEILTLKYDDTNNSITRGELYIVFDAEHIAKEAQSLSRISDDDPNMASLKQDIRGSILHGGMVSNTFIQSIVMVTGDYNIEKAIIGSEGLSIRQTMENTFSVKLQGTKALESWLVYNDDNKIELNVDASIKAITSNLSEQYKSIATYYCNTLKHIEQDKKDRTVIVQDIDTRLKRIAQDSLKGDTGLVYRTGHKRYAAARNQLVANTDLKRGEIRMPIDSFNALINIDKNAWIKEEDISHEELQDIFKTLQGMTPVEKYEYLLSIGIYEQSKNGYINFEFENPVWETVRGHKRLIYVEDFIYKPVLKRTVAYVLGARSPIQDYKATPVLKVVGLNQHSGMECHPAMYAYMGGDNDGDTAAFIPVKYDDVENGSLKYADSTKLEFYDEGYTDDDGNYNLSYLEKVAGISTDPDDNGKDGLFIKYENGQYILTGGEDTYKNSEIQYAHMGKKALPTNVAKLGDKHYLFTEMLSDAGKEYFDKLYSEAKEQIARDNVNGYLTFNNKVDNNKLRWVHAHIVYTHNGVSEPNELQGIYSDEEKWQAYYKQHEKEIERLQVIEHYIRHLLDNGNINIKRTMVEYAKNHTLYRGRVSKELIGVIGGLRKKAYLGTSLSVFPELNKDRTCKIWNTEYGIEDIKNFSLQDLITAVFNVTSIEQYKSIINARDVNELKNNKYFKQSRKNAVDIDKVLIYLQTRMKEIVEVNERVSDVYKLLFEKESITYADIKNVITDKEIYDSLLYMPVYKRILENMTTQELAQIADESTIVDIKAYYFSRFDKDNSKVEFKDKDGNKISINEYYTKQLLDQKIFTRAQAAKLDKAIQIPISESKHGSILPDPVVYEQQLKNRASAIVNALEGRKVYFGNDIEHARGIMMAFEYDMYKNRGISIEKPQDVSDKLSEIAEDNLRLQLPTDGVTKTIMTRRLSNAVEQIFKTDTCGSLMEKTDFELFKTHFKSLNNILTKYALENNSVLDINKLFVDATSQEIDTLINAIGFFQAHNIPCYKLKIGIVNAHAKYIEANRIVENVTKPELIANTLQLYLLCGTNYKELNLSYNTQAASDKQKYFMNYITGKDNPSELLVALLTEDNEVIKNNITTEMEHKYTREELFDDSLQKLSEQNLIQKEDYYKIKKALSQPLLEKVNDEILAKINFIAAQKGYTSLEILTQALANYMRIQKTLEIQNSKLEKEMQTHKSNKLINIIYERQLSSNLYKKDSQKIVEFRSKLTQLREQKKELEHKISINNNNISRIESTIKKLNDYIKYLTDKDPNTIVKNLQEERQQHKETLRETLRTITRQVMFEQLGDRMYEFDNSNNPNLPKPVTKLTQKEVNKVQDDLIVNMDKHQHPFVILVDAFKRTSKTGDEYTDWDAMYKYLKDNWRYIRVTQVCKAEETEGLAKRFLDYIAIQDTNKYKNSEGKEVEWKYLTKKEQKKYYKQHSKFIEFNTFEDIQNRFKEVVGKFTFKGKEYDVLDYELNIKDFFTPTLKQLHIKSAEDLKRIYKILISKGDEAPLIGFTYINDIIDSIETAYKPYRVDGFAAKYINKFNIRQKEALRLSSGFLLRNAIDVFNQLFTDMYIQKGLTPTLLKTSEIAKYLKYGDHIFQMYEFLNEERMFTLIHVLESYDLYLDANVSNEDKNNAHNIIGDYLNRYIIQAQNSTHKTTAIQKRLEIALQLQEQYNKRSKIPQTLKRITEFLTNTTFAEYYLFYDNKEINGKTIFGLRQDATNKNTHVPKKLQRIIKEQDPLFKSLLIEVSAFMQTKAQVDMFKQKQYEELFNIVNENRYKEDNNPVQLTLDEIRKQVNEFRYNISNKFYIWSKENIGDLYNNVTEYTENIARILGFILNRQLYGKSFNESVQVSLKNWFNYGQRTPIEIQLSYDIPYISFPIRSISNWIDRILDPKYAVFLDDIIDGIYGQYADEDGQYSEWEQFMIKNGWIPMFNGLGIRAGNGAFDIMNLLSNPTDNIKQRYNPILRGLNEFIESGDLIKAVKQLATFGVMNRVANTVAPRQLNQIIGIGSTKPKTLANSISMFFEYNEDEYNKYIPYRYRYSNNGRYKYYENIYKDWFNKYGRMRKPTKDPVTLVNNIQWQQYLRYKRNQYRR